MRKQALYLVLILTLSTNFCHASELFLETESFKDKGGWVLDSQFSLQMGSPYLLAHGLGEPVQNAKTTVLFPEKGMYHVWVRTKNWAPGKWKAPGVFKIIINGKEIPKELGTEKNWMWQYAGKVSVKILESTIELKDLTGFDGRCDAIYFSTEKDAPPNDYQQLATWRNNKLNTDKQLIEEKQFDLVIVGGGIAGCAAAIAAAEQGLNVALIHDRPVLGGNASSEVRVHTLGITWKYERILSKLNTQHWENGSEDAKADELKRMNNMMSYKNIHLFLQYQAFNCNAIRDSICWVNAREFTTKKIVRFRAPLFADCTGDGWIGYWAGAQFMYGREAGTTFNENYAELKNRISSHFAIKDTVNDSHKTIIAESKDAKVMGATLLWSTKDSDRPCKFPSVPWAEAVAKNYESLAGEWQWEYSNDSLNQIDNAEEVRDQMLMAIYGSFSNAKKDSKNAYKKLERVSYVSGKRESRRLIGDYIFTINDAASGTKFEDAVVKEIRAVDIHSQQSEINPGLPGFLSNAFYLKTNGYYIPYRCLYSKNISNLFMAGRNFSCSHLGLGGPRVMNTTGQMGCAVGYAASLCVKNSVSPRDVYAKHLPQLLQLIEDSNGK